MSVRDFFLNYENNIPFKLFDITHILMILLVVIGMLVIYIKRDKIKKIKNKKKDKIRLIMFIILISNMLIYYGSYIYYGVYDWHDNLPLHFCFIAGNLFMIYLLTKSRSLYKIVFFFTFIGPLPAIIYPDYTGAFDCFIFYQYFISHHLLILFSYFILYMDDFTIKLEDAFRALIYGNVIFISMMIFNKAFGTNYIMSSSLPMHILERYPFIENIWPPLILEVVGISVILLIYLLCYRKNKDDFRKSHKQ